MAHLTHAGTLSVVLLPSQPSVRSSVNPGSDRGAARRKLGAAATTIAAAFVCAAHAQTDLCADATVIAPGGYMGTTVGASNDGSATCGSSGVSPDVWYSFTPGVTGVLRLNTCGSAYDTVLSVHAGCPGVQANQLVCNDDTGGACGLGSTVQVLAQAGTTYLIRVSGFNGATGTYALNASLDPVGDGPDACTSAALVIDGTYTGSTFGSSNDGSAACGSSATSPDLWFRFDATQSCPIRLDTCGSNFDTVLSVHAACPGTTANQLACNDDTGGACGLGSTLEWNAAAGNSYLIRLAGFNGATGDYVLNVESRCGDPAPDACASAQALTPGTYRWSNAAASTDGSSCVASGHDVWFVYTPPEDQDVRVNTCASAFDTVLSVHTGCPGDAANMIACNDDSCGLGSSLLFAGARNTSYYIRVAGFQDLSGTFTILLRADTPGTGGADVYVGEMSQMVQLGRVGDVIGCAVDTPLCNSGGEPLETLRYPNANHPFFVFNLYRVHQDRIEQIGQSWAKHMQGSAQGNACGFGCSPYADGSHLGVGCSDIYGAAYNGTQSIMGPRSEINPWTGVFDTAGSHLGDPGAPAHSQVSHRLQIRDGDLDPLQNPGAVYLAEQYTLAHDDANHMNSLAREPLVVSGAPGGSWNLDLTASASVNGPAIFAWAGATSVFLQTEPANDGRCILSAKATDLGNGRWHYEYALYNHDMDRGVRGFSVRVDDAAITNVGFHAPFSHDEAFHNNPWEGGVADGLLWWTTDAYNVLNHSNPVRWGTLYNFRFDADRPPVASRVVLHLYKPGAPAYLSGTILGPAAACPADFNADGLVDFFDYDDFVACFELPDCAAGDFNADGSVDFFDYDDFVAAFEGGC